MKCLSPPLLHMLFEGRNLLSQVQNECVLNGQIEGWRKKKWMSLFVQSCWFWELSGLKEVTGYDVCNFWATYQHIIPPTELLAVYDGGQKRLLREQKRQLPPFKTAWLALASVGQLVGTLSHRPKGSEFVSWPGHMPRLQVQSLVGVRARANQSMFLSHITISFPLSLLPFPSP